LVVTRRWRGKRVCASGTCRAPSRGPSTSPLDTLDTPLHRIQADVFADYFQFYLWDANTKPHAPVDWTERDSANRLKVAPNVVAICPVRNMTVPVVVELYAREPGYVSDDWDHIAECSLDAPSGALAVEECTGGTAATLSVQAGTYRVRAHFGRLGSLSEDKLRGDDHYLVALWPAPLAPLVVLKQWQR
jgi:hypothetical protein